MINLEENLEGSVDHEQSFSQDVLGLVDGETEEQMEEKLHNEAKELGLDVCALLLQPQKPLSTRTFSSEARRSESVDSRASQSTGFASTFSERSREQYHPKSRHASRASLSFRDYDIFMARGRPDGRNSISFSPPTTPSHSTFSLPLSSPSSSPKRHFRRIRGLSMLRLNRNDSNLAMFDRCPHCPQDFLSQRRAVHRLSCGHRLCTPALKDMIISATASQSGAVPSCCGVPIPSSLLEHVMTQEEQNVLLNRFLQWNEAASVVLSTTSDIKEPEVDRRPGVGSRPASNKSKADSVVPHPHGRLDEMQHRPDFKQLQREQDELLERFSKWIEGERRALELRHEASRATIKARHENRTEELLEHHADGMAEAEDKQVKAEADMRESHLQEKRDNATALKHMEAYCAGTYSTGEANNRTVTEQDLAELEKTRRLRDAMDSKHESAINVLRGEQGRRMRLRAQRQEKELQELRRAQRKEELEFERACTSEINRLEELMREKRKKILSRWEIQVALFTKNIANEPHLTASETFSSVDWKIYESTTAPKASEESIKALEEATVKSDIPIGIAVSC